MSENIGENNIDGDFNQYEHQSINKE